MAKLRGEARDAESLGRLLQQARRLRGVSQRELAEQLGISQKYVWEMESGKENLFAQRLFAMLRSNNSRLIIEIDREVDE